MTLVGEKQPKVTVVDEETEVHHHSPTAGVLAEGNTAVALHLLARLRAHSLHHKHLQASRGVSRKDFIVIHAATARWARRAIHAVRSRMDSFLTPVVLLHEADIGELAGLVDATLACPVSETLFLEAIDRKFSKINGVLARLQEIPESTGDLGMRRLLLLRHLYSRQDASFLPKRDRCAKVGYTYALAGMLFNVAPGEEAAHFEALLESQLLHAELVDKVNVCRRCEHTQINFRELCPHCNSLNVNEEATIHHFRCAYVGRESEYNRGAQLICPKCHNELRHIGVDYDKPSEVLWCNNCRNNFSDPRLSCFCLACAHTFAPEDAIIKQISTYTLSLEGRRAAEEGVMPGYGLLNILKQELGFYRKEIFLEYLRVEIARCKRYGAPSTLSRFNLNGLLQSLDGKVAMTSRQFRRDFSAALKETYRKTDLFMELPAGDILILFLNTSADQAQIAYKRLADSMKKLFKVEIELRYTLHALTGMPEDVEQIWEKLK